MKRESISPYERPDGKWYFLDGETYYKDKEFGPYSTRDEAWDAWYFHWKWENEMNAG